jgi:hypothetical protein
MDLRRHAVVLRLPDVGGQPLEGLKGLGVAVAAGLGVAFAIESGGRLLLLLTAAVATSLTILLPADVFIAGALVVAGLSSMIEKYTVHAHGATFYSTDLVVMLAVVRALRPADRFPPTRVAGSFVAAATGAWALLMLYAGIRGWQAGESLVTLVRYETALFYLPALYFSLSRLLRERTLNLSRLWALLAAVSVGFACWMFVMRILNHPFENISAGGSHLGEVTTSQGFVVRRDFGSAAAFIIYPALALAAVAAMAHSGRRGAGTVLAFIGLAATFATLVRAEIFGMLLGLATILLLRARGKARTSRAFTAAVLVCGALALLLAVAYVNPAVRDAVVQRTLPGLVSGSRIANQNAEYRMQALRLGARVADAHASGIGFRNDDVLTQSGIDPGYLGHSVPAWLLVFLGWPGLVAATALLFALLVRSFRLPSAVPWLHPAFVGVLLMLIVYSFGASGFVVQPWVMILTGMAVALRFALARLPA